MGYFVEENLEALEAHAVFLTEGGDETRREAWLEYAVMLSTRPAPWGCLGLWIREQTPEHLEWLPTISLRRY